jgi:hypothetical protein
MKGTIHHKEISILNIHAPNTASPSTLKRKQTNKNSNGPKSTDGCQYIIEDLNTPLSLIGHPDKRSTKKLKSYFTH